jgi:serine/threonine-protein kinase
VVDERENRPDFSPATDDPRRDFDEATYRYVSLIGSGGMGEVIEAEDVRLRTRVAIKRLRNVAIDPVEQVQARDRMRLEGEVQAKLVHPALLRVFAAGVTRSGCPFLVSELLVGRTLGAELKERGFLPVPEALSVICTVLAGLDYAHSTANVVHRDIKPDNIFLTDAPPGGTRGVKVVDFGLAKVVDASRNPRAPAGLVIPTATGTALGSPRFMSPEQARGDKSVDRRADIYGVGATLYAMIAGRGPFDHHRNIHELMVAHTAEPPQPPSQHARQPVPPDLDRAILKALAKAPQDRFQTAAEFAAELARIAGDLARGPAAVAPDGRRWGATEQVASARGPIAAPVAAEPRTVKGTMLMAENTAVRDAGQRYRDSLAAAPLAYAPTTELPRLAEPTTELPQSYAAGAAPPPARPSPDRAADATLVSRSIADQRASKQRRALVGIAIITILLLGVIAGIAILKS